MPEQLRSELTEMEEIKEGIRHLWRAERVKTTAGILLVASLYFGAILIWPSVAPWLVPPAVAIEIINIWRK